VIDWATALPIIIGIIGLAGIVFTAMRFGRDDTTAVVNQQAQITSEMKTLNDELRLTLERIRKERDACHVEVERLTGRIEELRGG
jgi:hypothetical protein